MTGHMFYNFETEIIENRRHPRYPVDEVGTLCGMPVKVRNISRTGAQLACSTESFAQVKRKLSRAPVLVELNLQALVSLSADVIYAIECDGQRLIGIHFGQMGRVSRALIDEYIATL